MNFHFYDHNFVSHHDFFFSWTTLLFHLAPSGHKMKIMLLFLLGTPLHIVTFMALSAYFMTSHIHVDISIFISFWMALMRPRE